MGERLLEKLVKDRLQKLGYQVDLKVGYSDYKIDLAVAHPDNPSRYILAIETDGESFTSANSTIERDIIRQDFLERRGWAVERIWSRNWWQDSNREINRLQQRIVQLRQLNSRTSDANSRDVASQSSTTQIPFELPSSITPQTPFSNKKRYRKALESTEGYIHWIDKWFSSYGFEILSECSIRQIKEIKILTSLTRVNKKERKTFIDYSEEMKQQYGITCEMRVLKDIEIEKAIHDRWIV